MKRGWWTGFFLVGFGLIVVSNFSHAADKGKSDGKTPSKTVAPTKTVKPSVAPSAAPRAVPIGMTLSQRGKRVFLVLSREAAVQVFLGDTLVQKFGKGKEFDITDAVKKAGEGNLHFICTDEPGYTEKKILPIRMYAHLFQPKEKPPVGPSKASPVLPKTPSIAPTAPVPEKAQPILIPRKAIPPTASIAKPELAEDSGVSIESIFTKGDAVWVKLTKTGQGRLGSVGALTLDTAKGRKTLVLSQKVLEDLSRKGFVELDTGIELKERATIRASFAGDMKSPTKTALITPMAALRPKTMEALKPRAVGKSDPVFTKKAPESLKPAAKTLAKAPEISPKTPSTELKIPKKLEPDGSMAKTPEMKPKEPLPASKLVKKPGLPISVLWVETGLLHHLGDPLRVFIHSGLTDGPDVDSVELLHAGTTIETWPAGDWVTFDGGHSSHITSGFLGIGVDLPAAIEAGDNYRVRVNAGSLTATSDPFHIVSDEILLDNGEVAPSGVSMAFTSPVAGLVLHPGQDIDVTLQMTGSDTAVRLISLWYVKDPFTEPCIDMRWELPSAPSPDAAGILTIPITIPPATEGDGECGYGEFYHCGAIGVTPAGEYIENRTGLFSVRPDIVPLPSSKITMLKKDGLPEPPGPPPESGKSEKEAMRKALLEKLKPPVPTASKSIADAGRTAPEPRQGEIKRLDTSGGTNRAELDPGRFPGRVSTVSPSDMTAQARPRPGPEFPAEITSINCWRRCPTAVGSGISIHGNDFGRNEGHVDIALREGVFSCGIDEWGEALVRCTIPISIGETVGRTEKEAVIWLKPARIEPPEPGTAYLPGPGGSGETPYYYSGEEGPRYLYTIRPMIPRIESLSRSEIEPMQELRIEGSNFGASPGSLRFNVPGESHPYVTQIVSWTNTRVRMQLMDTTTDSYGDSSDTLFAGERRAAEITLENSAGNSDTADITFVPGDAGDHPEVDLHIPRINLSRRTVGGQRQVLIQVAIENREAGETFRRIRIDLRNGLSMAGWIDGGIGGHQEKTYTFVYNDSFRGDDIAFDVEVDMHDDIPETDERNNRCEHVTWRAVDTEKEDSCMRL